jgi:hypothetical protein
MAPSCLCVFDRFGAGFRPFEPMGIPGANYRFASIFRVRSCFPMTAGVSKPGKALTKPEYAEHALTMRGKSGSLGQ